jgi:hypothetical protein
MMSPSRSPPSVAGPLVSTLVMNAPCAHDTGRHCPRKPEGVADGDGDAADLELLRAPESGVRQIVPGDAEHGEVRMRIFTDHARGLALATGQRDHDSVGPGDDVAVRENEPVRREHESGAAAALRSWISAWGPAIRPSDDVDLGRGGPHPFGDARHRPRVGVEQLVIPQL